MTTGAGGSSWRTRHLRIRAASLRQCLGQDEWTLRHLKGNELVADGFTKGLYTRVGIGMCKTWDWR